ncbi:MAG: hypothetical protein V4459_00875 [Pseudomonadota bacterium]
MPTLNQREYYARRALEVRKLAQAATDADIREALETMASSYDKLVVEADRIQHMRARLYTPK